MKVLFINSVCATGSTGKIAYMQAKKMIEEGHEVLFAYGRDSQVPDSFVNNTYRISGKLFVYEHILETRLFDNHGFASRLSTKRFIKKLNEFQPDLVWLHNIHGYYINIVLLFNWLKMNPKTQVRWTLHDCWTFTGHCTYFLCPECKKWMDNCEKCTNKSKYPASFLLNRASKNYRKKRDLFTGIDHLTIITPSKWLADLVKLSFLKEYPVSVEYNKIDKNIFRPTYTEFKNKFELENKFIILGVANVWSYRKGYNDFLSLAKLFTENNLIQFIMVGLSEDQKKELPKNILGFSRTESVQELVEIYNSANIFFNPTYEDNFPTVNLEAEACGTCVLTYDTGGCAETIKRNDSKLIAPGDITRAKDIILELFNNHRDVEF